MQGMDYNAASGLMNGAFTGQELQINDVWYRSGKLDAFKQFHLFRKLMPLFSGLGETAATNLVNNAVKAGASEETARWASLGPIAQAVSEMSQQDSEFIIKTCLGVCARKNPVGQWSRITAPNGELMFEDIDLMTMLQLAFAVIQDNLGTFFPGQPLSDSGGESVPTSNPSI
jgi:hypothetical protein